MKTTRAVSSWILAIICSGAAGCGASDYVEEVAFEEQGITTTVDVYEAEKSSFQKGCRTSRKHEGYSGTGFVDFGGSGSLVEWGNVTVSSAGQYTLVFRYANGGNGDRQSAITVNGTTNAGNVAFGSTHSWATWGSNSIQVTLRAGNNTIRVTANTGSGGPNLDKMDVKSSGGGEASAGGSSSASGGNQTTCGGDSPGAFCSGAECDKLNGKFNLCCLCGDCKLSPGGRGNSYLAEGKTCNQLSLSMGKAKPGSSSCRDLQNKYHRVCCTNDVPMCTQDEPPDLKPLPQIPAGDEPWCNLCKHGGLPGKPNTVTAVLYISGNPTCEDLFWMGRMGQIPDRVCNPLALWATGPCGCEKESKLKYVIQPEPTPKRNHGKAATSVSEAALAR